MIDFIKIDISHVSESNLLWNPLLKDGWSSSVHRATGNVRYPYECNYQGLKFTFLSNEYRELSGSLHKYYNLVDSDKNHNFNQFGLENIRWVIAELERQFELSAELCRIKNIEFGVNLLVDSHPKELIQRNVIAYKNHHITELKTYGTKGLYTEHESTEYYIKVYDKTSQYRLDKNILRFEVKTKKSRHVADCQIRTLADICDREKLLLLSDKLRKALNHMKIVDESDLEVFSSGKERLDYQNFINPKYWEKVATLDKDEAYRANKRFKGLLKKYKLLRVKDSLLTQFDRTVYYLLKEDCPFRGQSNTLSPTSVLINND